MNTVTEAIATVLGIAPEKAKTLTAKQAYQEMTEKNVACVWNYADQMEGRTYGNKGFCSLLESFSAGGIDKTMTLGTFGMGPCNLASVVRLVFESDKTYTIQGAMEKESVTGDIMIKWAEDWDAFFKGIQFPSIHNGRHRGASETLSHAFGADGCNVRTVEYESIGDAKVQDLMGNHGHAAATRLTAESRLLQILELKREKIVTAEGDLRTVCGFDRHYVQTLWCQARMVSTFGLKPSEASKVAYKKYLAVTKEAKAEGYMSDKARVKKELTEAKTIPTMLPRSKVMESFTTIPQVDTVHIPDELIAKATKALQEAIVVYAKSYARTQVRGAIGAILDNEDSTLEAVCNRVS